MIEQTLNYFYAGNIVVTAERYYISDDHKPKIDIPNESAILFSDSL